MNIIKLGGSIINPNGKYDDNFINKLIQLVGKSKEKFIFIVGGGKLCRNIQHKSKTILKKALLDSDKVNYANDWLGIAVTHINAHYVLEKFKMKLGKNVYPELLMDPTAKVKSSSRIFFAGGWKPGHSTDTDMMILAKTFEVGKAFKISDIKYVKDINPIKFSKLSKKKKRKTFQNAEIIETMTWPQLKALVGTKWIPGLNTPFDEEAVKIGLKSEKKEKKITLHIGNKEALTNLLNHKRFKSTIIK